ncbi:hypothetical protein BTA51_28350 [Hahella sp. CCB-MM4]|uniref:hemerythrin domain-containing protein n=1 Tax=Hahella sp. (strain CCB-MM4) TaxID=1926491 RepID=UPI000B9AFAB7|nr:hemerythrin domain-containing protein [Hahella sp. CCB-MM4]OZG69984.1 hypothetical protein BTA51_28350 [Hahella sp. CCB-MM4]
MHPLLEELLNYHRQASAVIKEISKLNQELTQTDASDIRDLLINSLEELKSEEERNHHFNEELVREALMSTEAPIHRSVEQIAKDHAAFGRIMSSLQSQCQDDSCTDEELSSMITDYIDKYFDHLEAEETIFFPMAEKWLDEDLWANVQEKWR